MDKATILEVLEAVILLDSAGKSATSNEEYATIYVRKDVLEPLEDFKFIDDTRKKGKGDKARARSEWKNRVRNIRK